MSLRDALSRTLLLMRDEIREDADDDTLVGALTSTTVALVTDHANIASHSAQTAYVTAALMMARSGHSVHLVGPNTELLRLQPPLKAGRVIDQLALTGRDILPGVELQRGAPASMVDVALVLGDSPVSVDARRIVYLNSGPWSGGITNAPHRWTGGEWPIGAMAAAALGAAEAFKVSMRRLAHLFRNPDRISSVFADCGDLAFHVAPPNTVQCAQLGTVDCVSGGAIINAVLYAFARLPEAKGRFRIIEPECSDLSNLNRYMLFLRSAVGGLKVEDLAACCYGTGLQIESVDRRFDRSLMAEIAPMARSVLVGVDHIPSRWAVQEFNPEWLVVGATTHWSAMASFHTQGLGCAQCLHPTDDENVGLIPTVAFVSFWSGLLCTAYLLRHCSRDYLPVTEQQIYLTALRAENPVWSAVPVRPECPTCSGGAAFAIAHGNTKT